MSQDKGLSLNNTTAQRAGTIEKRNTLLCTHLRHAIGLNTCRAQGSSIASMHTWQGNEHWGLGWDAHANIEGGLPVKRRSCRTLRRTLHTTHRRLSLAATTPATNSSPPRRRLCETSRTKETGLPDGTTQQWSKPNFMSSWNVQTGLFSFFFFKSMLLTNYNTSKDCCSKTPESHPNSVLRSTLWREKKFLQGRETGGAKQDKAFTAGVLPTVEEIV